MIVSVIKLVISTWMVLQLSPVPTSADKSEGDSCNARIVNDDPNKIVCVCSLDSCPQIGQLSWPENSNQVYVYTSNRAGKRFHLEKLKISDEQVSSSSHKSNNKYIKINLNKTYQTIIGFGGAFTDATGSNIKSLPKDLQTKLVESYYGESGLQYNFGRVPIGGSDFSSRPYTYDDSKEADYDLKQWSLASEDMEYKIPYIKHAMELCKSRNVDLKMFASPWSPPIWMKTNAKIARGHLIDDDKIYKAYTEYLMKFYDSYKEQGINFWGATVQNEPVAANLFFYFFNSLQINNEEMIKLITKYLGPALEKRGYTKRNFKLMIGDDSIGFINYQVPQVMQNTEVTKYVSGLAFHWYTSGLVSYDKLTEVYESIKDKIEFMIMSEACEGSFPYFQKKVDLGSWSRAERYASDIIEDLNRNTNGWIDWNMALDLKGGPNWAKNYVDSPILVDSKEKQFYFQPMYYSLGHFSRFLKPDVSVRVEAEFNFNGQMFAVKPMATVFHNKKTNHLIINLLNTSSKTSLDIMVQKSDNKTVELRDLLIDERSINSIIIKL